MESDSRSATDICLKEISVDFIKTRPTSDLELVFKDDAGVKHKSSKFKNGALVHWDLDIYVRTHTSARLIIQRAFFKIKVAVISVKFKPDEFGDDKVVRLEDSNHCVIVTFVCGRSKPLADVTRVLGPQATSPNTVGSVDTQQPLRQLPSIQFRVLIIGRANAGKTSILQRVCETTDSPVIHRGQEEVTLNPSMNRGEHSIDDQLVFSNHRGYIFHDSRGIESGSTEELEILQEFIRRKCGETRLRDRLHAIWYCVPMDNQRPILDLKFFRDVCPDQNDTSNVSEVAEQQFQEHYLNPLGKDIGFVRLEKMHRQNMRCDDLLEKTIAVLNGDVVTLMLLAVQRDNLELSVKTALNRVRSRTGSISVRDQDIVRDCLVPFPYIWFVSTGSYSWSRDRLTGARWYSTLQFDVSSCRGLLHFKPDDNTCPGRFSM
ncbi:hypothetical protein EDB87DRAFT_1164094 [Lactarius vividus]|nr:hypothetical protein EDB87DRAFT_1164094 [Lactarius vividus]